MTKTSAFCIDVNAALFGMNGTRRILTGLILAVAVMLVPRDAMAGQPTRPMVSNQDPANGATGVAINKEITLTFSEPMDPSRITASTFTLKRGTGAVRGTVTYAGVTATFTPLDNLAPNILSPARARSRNRRSRPRSGMSIRRFTVPSNAARNRSATRSPALS